MAFDKYRSNLIKHHHPNYLVQPHSPLATLAQMVVYFLLQHQYQELLTEMCNPAWPRCKSNTRHHGGFSNISPWIHGWTPNTRRYGSRRSWLRRPMLCRARTCAEPEFSWIQGCSCVAATDLDWKEGLGYANQVVERLECSRDAHKLDKQHMEQDTDTIYIQTCTYPEVCEAGLEASYCTRWTWIELLSAYTPRKQSIGILGNVFTNSTNFGSSFDDLVGAYNRTTGHISTRPFSTLH